MLPQTAREANAQAFTSQFVKTDAYVQINGLWDGTKVNIPYGDSGGELDPHVSPDFLRALS